MATSLPTTMRAAVIDVGHLPKSLDLQRAGALTVVGLTALQGVDDALDLKAESR